MTLKTNSTSDFTTAGPGERPPKISIVIPTFNRSELVQRAVESALRQSYTNYEVIVVDDGSTDDTRERLRPYMQRIRYHYQTNCGATAAQNAGLRLARGQWVAILASDDTWEAGKLEMQIKAVESAGEGVGACFTDCRFLGNPGITETSFQSAGLHCNSPSQVVDRPFRYMIEDRFAFCVQSMLASRALLLEIGGFDDQLKLNEDRELVFRLSFKTRFCAIPSPLVNIDRTPSVTRLTNACAERTDEVFEWNERVWRTMLANPCLEDAAIRESLQHELMNVYYDGAAWKAQSMNLRGTWSYMARIHAMGTSYLRISGVMALRAMRKTLHLHQATRAIRNPKATAA